MANHPRTPPRFVPTLTTVIEPSSDPAAAGPAPGAPERPEASPTSRRALEPDSATLSDAHAFGIEEDLLHRVLQRVDLSLEEKLSDAVSAAVQVQLDAMVPRLRAEIESVLRGLVVDALARELSESTGSARISGT